MKVNVLLQPKQSQGYIATVLGWPNLIIEGTTKDEALKHARESVTRQLAQFELFTLDLEQNAVDPWAKFAGMWEDDPTFDDFLSEVAAYRKELDGQEQE